ncbi:3-hydroxybutyryl-CoA dehydrogenase, partial [Salmonella sp. gx-f4]|nr:3-hydroxybutyryl-CoA dehydrogenase [Salmonella sp. gx-f4]
MSTISTVAILGAGQMGADIAQAVALGGYSVRLYDVVADRRPMAHGEIAARLARQAGRGLVDPAAADAALARITPANGI